MLLPARERGRYVFRCPTCRKSFVYDEPVEPLCTGPHPGLDEHEPTVMVALDVPLDVTGPIVLPGRIIG